MTAFPINLLHRVVHLPKFIEANCTDGKLTPDALEAVVRELPEFQGDDGQQKAGDVSQALFGAVQGLKANDVNDVVDSLYGLVQQGMFSADEITEQLIVEFTSSGFGNKYRELAHQGVENLKVTNRKAFDSLIAGETGIIQDNEELSYANKFIDSLTFIKKYFPEIQNIKDPIERLGLYGAILREIDGLIHDMSETRTERTEQVVRKAPIPEATVDSNGSYTPLIAGLIGLVTTLGGFIFSKEKVKNVTAAIGAFLAAATATAAVKGDGKMSNGFLDGKGALAVGGGSLALIAIPFLLFESKVKESFTSIGAAVLGGILSHKFEFIRGLVGFPVDKILSFKPMVMDHFE